MERDWSQVIGPPGAGARFAEALGCLSTHDYVTSVLESHDYLMRGIGVTISANRIKLHPVTGDVLEDHRETGDYITNAYVFEFDTGSEEGDYFVERLPEQEGEQIAADYAHALGLKADREFCESMAQLKGAFDRFGGFCEIAPVVLDERIVGLEYHYKHLVKERRKKAPEAEPGPQPDDATPPPTASEEQAPEDQGEDAADSPDPASETALKEVEANQRIEASQDEDEVVEEAEPEPVEA